MKRKGGISLVALVVTIIVLIILTGAVVATFMEGGIIDKAKEAVMKSDSVTLQEAYNVAYNTAKIEEMTGTGEPIDEIGILQEVVEKLGLKGFIFLENDVEYNGDNEEILKWIKERFIFSSLVKKGYDFSTINGKSYMIGINSKIETEDGILIGATVAKEILNAGFTLEGEWANINEDLNDDGIIEESMVSTGMKILKNGKECATIIILGDLNADGCIDGGDVNFTFEMINGTIVGTDIELLAADVNNDGYVCPTDAKVINSKISDIYSSTYWKVGISGTKNKMPVPTSEPQYTYEQD